MYWQQWLSSLSGEDLLSLLADGLSVVGFVVTVFVAFQVNAIRNYYRLRGRAPQQTTALRREAKRLLPLWGDIDTNRTQIVEVLYDIEVASRSLRATLRGELARDNRSIHVRVRELRGAPRSGAFAAVVFRQAGRQLTHDELRWVYNECNTLWKNVREDIKNQDWAR